MEIPFQDQQPRFGREVFRAPGAWVVGDVELGDNVSIFFGAVLRGDLLPIRVGSRTNIQEHALLHTSRGRTPAVVGQEATIGHRAIIHGCTIGDRCLVGMGAIILDEAVVGDESLVGAAALVTERTVIPPRSLVLGAPAKVIRELTAEEVERLHRSADDYVETGRQFIETFLRAGISS